MKFVWIFICYKSSSSLFYRLRVIPGDYYRFLIMKERSGLRKDDSVECKRTLVSYPER